MNRKAHGWRILAGRGAIVATLALLVVFSQGITADAGGQKLTLKWPAVARAAGYKIIVKNEAGETVLEVTSLDNRITLRLPDGTYRYRIGVLNKFQKLQYWTEELPIAIDRKFRPEIAGASPARLMTQRGRKRLLIRGENFSEESKLTIVAGKRSLPIRGFAIKDRQTMEAELDTDGAVVGRYDIVVQNKGLYTASKKDAIEIVPLKLEKRELSDALWRSALFPGWGQLRQRRWASAAIFSSLFVGLAYSTNRSRLEHAALREAYSRQAPFLTAAVLSTAPTNRLAQTGGFYLEGDRLRLRMDHMAERFNRLAAATLLVYTLSLGETWWLHRDTVVELSAARDEGFVRVSVRF